MRISREGIVELKRRNDLCEVALEHGIELKRKGQTYFGLCPFHQEKTASFAVSRESGLFHCFGCGVGGDVIGFVVRFHGVTFREALKRLAVRAGVDLAAFCDESSVRTARSTQNTIDAEFSRKLHVKAAQRFSRLAAQRTDGGRQTVVGSEKNEASTLPSTNYRLPSVVGRRSS